MKWSRLRTFWFVCCSIVLCLRRRERKGERETKGMGEREEKLIHHRGGNYDYFFRFSRMYSSHSYATTPHVVGVESMEYFLSDSYCRKTHIPISFLHFIRRDRIKRSFINAINARQRSVSIFDSFLFRNTGASYQFHRYRCRRRLLTALTLSWRSQSNRIDTHSRWFRSFVLFKFNRILCLLLMHLSIRRCDVIVTNEPFRMCGCGRMSRAQQHKV